MDESVIRSEADKILLESLEIGGLNSEGTLKLVAGPFGTQDQAAEALSSRAHVLWSSGSQWWVTEPVRRDPARS